MIFMFGKKLNDDNGESILLESFTFVNAINIQKHSITAEIQGETINVLIATFKHKYWHFVKISTKTWNYVVYNCQVVQNCVIVKLVHNYHNA